MLQRGLVFGVLAGLMLVGASRTVAQDYSSPFYYCCLIDDERQTIWDASFGYVFEGSNDAPGWDDIGFINLKASAGLVYFETEYGGDVDLRAETDTRILQGFDGTSSGFPLSMINLNLRWDQRFQYGWGMQVDFKPGLYSSLDDFGGSNWAFPVSLSGVRALNEGLSVLLGLSVYPGFDRVLDPKLGLRWKPSDDVLIDLFYPETHLQFGLADGVDVHLRAKFLTWLEYQMEDEDPRDRIRLDENSLTAGLGLQTSEYGKWSFDVGYYFDRNIDFEEVDAGVDIDDAFGITIGYSSLF